MRMTGLQDSNFRSQKDREDKWEFIANEFAATRMDELFSEAAGLSAHCDMQTDFE
jgi:hypothetical protein